MSTPTPSSSSSSSSSSSFSDEPESDFDDGIRNYQFVGMSALVVVALALLGNASGNLLVLLVLIPALLGMSYRVTSFYRWTAAPGVFLLGVMYLQLFPTGFPMLLTNSIAAPAIPFRMHDFMLMGGVLVYCVCQYRLFSLTIAAMPSDRIPIKRTAAEKPIVRSESNVTMDEFYRFVFVVVLSVCAAHVLWFITMLIVVEPKEMPPIRLWSPKEALIEFKTDPASASRFMFLAGVVGVGTLGTWFLFWYWTIQRLRPQQAKMILLDTAWQDLRGDISRQEKWRAWGRGTYQAVSGRDPTVKTSPVRLGCLFIVLFFLAMLFGSILIYALS